MELHRITLLAAVVSVVAASHGHAGGGTPITTCGQVVTTNAFLTQDLYCPGTFGIGVSAAGITIDLKGFTLRGDRTAGTYGIDDHLGFGALTIKNGVVRNFDTGVAAYIFASKVTITNLVASGNATDGIYVFGDAATIQSTTAAGNGGIGIDVTGDSAKIKASNASENRLSGIGVTGAQATIQSTTASRNVVDGIFVSGATATIKSCTADGNDEVGIIVYGNSATIRSSATAGNFAGVLVTGDSATVQSSTASANTQDGISVSGDAAVIKKNRAEANGLASGKSDLDGLGIRAADYSTAPVGKNVARGNDNPEECSPLLLC